MSFAHRAARLARKLRGRSATELRARAAQVVAARLERTGMLDGRDPGTQVPAVAAALRAPVAWRDRLRQAEGLGGSPRFFAGLADREATVAAIGRHDPAHAAAVLARAERLIGGRFDLLGHEGLEFGSPIDWHLDPLAGVRGPMAHWSRIDYLDPRVAGDHKVVWELNRHQWLVTLGEAYWLTGDARWAGAIVTRLVAWMDANPPKRGVNWASSLEVAFRAMAWCWVMKLLADSESLTSDVAARLTGFLALHARHIERNLSTYFSPNTHLTGEALGMFHVGLLFPELRGATRWRERAWRVLTEQLPIHARPDGVYFEQAAYYHRYTVDFYTHLLVLAERNGVSGARSAIGPDLERLLEHLMFVARPDGTVPLTGDEDGGQLTRLDERRPDDVRSPLAAGALLFDRPDFAFVAGEPTAEMIWLLGPDAPERFAALGAVEPEGTSRAFPDGGVYVMRDGWSARTNQLVLDCGPHGMMNCGHAHADALSFEATVGGRPVLVEPGTYAYTVNPAMRDWFRATEAHNALVLDGESSSVPDGPFHWAHIARSESLAWHAFVVADWFEGRHDGYRRLPSPAVHRRGVMFVKADDGPHYWAIRDVIESDGDHDAALTFQCDQAVSVAALEQSAATLVAGGDAVLRLTCAMSGRDAGEGGGRFERDERWVSRRYGARSDATRLRFLFRSRGTTSVVTLMIPSFPTRAGEPPVPSVDLLSSAGGIALAIRFADWSDLLLFDADGSVGVVSTDAPVAWVRRRHDGTVQAAMLAGGGRLEASGLILSAGLRGAASARLVSEQWLIEGEGAQFDLHAPSSSSRTSLITRL